MRIHDDATDRPADFREGSADARQGPEGAVADAGREASLRAAAGRLAYAPAHDWDDDTAGWVRRNRHPDARQAY